MKVFFKFASGRTEIRDVGDSAPPLYRLQDPLRIDEVFDPETEVSPDDIAPIRVRTFVRHEIWGLGSRPRLEYHEVDPEVTDDDEP